MNVSTRVGAHESSDQIEHVCMNGSDVWHGGYEVRIRCGPMGPVGMQTRRDIALYRLAVPRCMVADDHIQITVTHRRLHGASGRK